MKRGKDRTRKENRKRTGIRLMALVVTSAVLLYVLWRRGALLPGWIRWEKGTFYDASGAYEIRLNHRAIDIAREGKVIWSSPDGVKVQEALSGDIDRDGQDELFLLCWKIGRYGRYKPFWVQKDERKWSQHIFVYEYDGDAIRPKWMSSDIGQEAEEIALRRMAESAERLLITDRKGDISCWIWDSWGFTKVEGDVSFVVFGDNLIHEPLYRYGLQQEDFGFLFAGVADLIAESDVAVIGQETPLVEEPDLYGGYPRFGTPAQVGQAIADAGFRVAACATNHALDRGMRGIDTTKRILDDGGVLCLGIQSEEEPEYKPYEILVRKGIRFALLDYTYGTNGIRLPEGRPYAVHLLEDERKVAEDIRAAQAEADFVIVFVHWGTENAQEIDEFQRRWADVFLKSGVDVVVGSHPHVLQPCELLQDAQGHEMLIYYSVGNYISAQPESSCIKGGAACFTVSFSREGYRIGAYSLQPLCISRREDGGYTVTAAP